MTKRTLSNLPLIHRHILLLTSATIGGLVPLVSLAHGLDEGGNAGWMPMHGAGGMYGIGGGMEWGGPFWGFAALGMLLWWGALLALVVLGGLALFRFLHKREQGGKSEAVHSQTDSAVIIARERFARGEISKEEFQQILTELQQAALVSPQEGQKKE